MFSALLRSIRHLEALRHMVFGREMPYDLLKTPLKWLLSGVLKAVKLGESRNRGEARGAPGVPRQRGDLPEASAGHRGARALLRGGQQPLRGL